MKIQINFQDLQDNCINAGWIKDGIKMCGCINGRPAQVWADWDVCKPSNCYILKKKKAAAKKEDPEQITMFEYSQGFIRRI